jgi:hypothetical protein
MSALPSPLARALAFGAICLGGLGGGVIGRGFVDLQCHGDCELPRALGTVVAAPTAAGGTAVVAILVLRAMGEWAFGQPGGRDPARTPSDRQE